MNVTVKEVWPVHPHSSIAMGRGVDDAGNTVQFAGEFRLLSAIAEALDAGEVVEVYLESWQVLSRGRDGK